MEFYVKKYTQAPRFHAHYNREMGKYYDTKREYYGDMKAKGLEPYRGSDVHKRTPKLYQSSKWAKDISRTLEREGLTGCVKEELAKAGIKDVPKNIPKTPKGGWF